MPSIRNDFSKFLTEIGYSQSTAYNYAHYLNKFAKGNEYADLVALADDVFILLDRGIHGNRDFNHKILAAIKKNKSVLTLFNSFLFDVNFKRDFVIPCSSSTNCMQVLSTVQSYKQGSEPRRLVDYYSGTNKTETGKEYFTSVEVADALHINERTLRRWAKDERRRHIIDHIPRRYKGIPPEIAGNQEELNKYNNKLFDDFYYKLDELNDFLEFQSEFGSPEHKAKYMCP